MAGACHTAVRHLLRQPSARSTNPMSGIRRPNSTDSTVYLGYWTRWGRQPVPGATPFDRFSRVCVPMPFSP